jgi:hypothetical protein
MTFLKQIGLWLAKAVPRAIEFFPLFGGFLHPKTSTTIGNDLVTLQQIVTTVEAIFAATHDPNLKTGPEKFAAARPLVKTLIQHSEALAGKNIKDTALFDKAVDEYLQATVDLLNSVDPPTDPKS